ncbi:MAG: serine/threonine-protein kinase, partial [Cyanobacteria bacterium J06635_13]
MFIEMGNSEYVDFYSNIFGVRYQVERILVDKNAKKTLLAKDTQTKTLVVIKLLIFNDSFSWDILRLFEREAQTLKALSHPAIPKYLDYLEIDTEDTKGFLKGYRYAYAIVQSYIETLSLKEQVHSGRVFNEAEVKELATSILEILEYLHSHQPAIIHRDIKPSNILLGDRAGNSIGQIYLIDFGSVQNITADNSKTITVVGTYGYMPPEQFGGRVKPASDLYSLGATLIYLVTGEHPVDLPENDLRIEFEEFCNLSPGFVDWLKQMTNPSVGSRIASATQALEKLAECENYQGGETRRFVRPADSDIYLTKDRNALEVILPGKNYSGDDKVNLAGIMLFCLLPWIIALLALVMGIPIEVILGQFLRYLGILLISALAAGGLGYKLLTRSLTSKKLIIDRTTATLRERLLGFDRNYVFIRSSENINKLEKNTVERSDSVYSSLNIYFGNDKFELIDTDDYPVTFHDINWIGEELNIWLNIPMAETSVDERTA